ncbi:MAG TPA: NADH-quinone oxidoreductase subunit K [Beutenbergiaceae bacterium]|nr:NADH-quinone oxidoreductase subunit K [Beutenbergiaceae bacterium]
MSRPDLFLLLGVALSVLGIARLLLTGDLLARVIGLNIASGGVMMLLLSSALRSGSDGPDAVPHAMVLTGIVITVSVTALAVVLIRRIESDDDAGGEQS